MPVDINLKLPCAVQIENNSMADVVWSVRGRPCVQLGRRRANPLSANQDFSAFEPGKKTVSALPLPLCSPLQVSSMDFIAMKRSQLYGLANNPYSSPQQPGGGPYPPSQPYTSPPQHRYPMSMQGRSQIAMGGMQYPQQQVRQPMPEPLVSSTAPWVHV